MQFSYSKVSTFLNCPYKFYLIYIKKLDTLPSDDVQSPLILGHALHTGIEANTEEALKEYFNSYPIITDRHLDEAIKLEYWIDKVKKQVPDGQHEVKLLTKDFIGFIDLLVPIELPFEYDYDLLDLYDFKYSNNIAHYKESGQLHLYKYYYEKLNPTKQIGNMYLVFIPKIQIRQKYKNKSNPRDETLYEFRNRLMKEMRKKEIQIVKVDYDEKQVEQFKENCDIINDHITTENFPKNKTRLCDWCEFQEFCEKGENYMLLPKNERRKINVTDKKVMWIYGQPFSGKTQLADKFPDPLMLNTDGNIKYVTSPYIAIKDIVTVEGRITKRKLAWEVFKEAIEELEKKQNDFKTIVVDLVEDTYESCRLYMYEQLGITHESDDSFRAWDKVRIEFLSTMRKLMNLDYENIILISHEDMTKDITKKSGDKITAIKPNINEKCANKLAGMVDIVMRAVAEDGNYTLSFKKSEVIFGGGRLKVEEREISNSYEAVMEIYNEANESAEKKEQPKAEEAKEPEEQPKQEEKEEVEQKPKRRRRRQEED